jgi:crotonobetainyl-CoA:carnitine CoA-transferase CaiB-like acyl-CoA transferase
VTAFGLENKIRERTGNRNPSIVPASDFETADGRRLSVHAGTDRLFRRLASVMNMPELAGDGRFANRADRIRNQEELYRIVGSWVAGLTSDEAAAVLSAANIPVSPVMSVADLMADPHCAARGSIVTVPDPDLGDIPMIAPLPRMSATPGTIRWPGPRLGVHTEEVLSEILGMAAGEIAALRRDGVL